jgi:hypothetical protein
MKTLRIVLISFAALLALSSGIFLVKNYHIPTWKGTNRFTDFIVYYEAGQRFNVNADSTYSTPGITPETGGTYNYPPFSIIYFAPLAKLSLPAASLVFSIFSLSASFIITFFVLRIMKEYFIPPTRTQTIAAYIFTASFVPVLHDLKHGQVNEIVAMCAVVFIWFLLKQKYGVAAFVLFMGFWLKIYSLMLLIFVLPFLFVSSGLYKRFKNTVPAWKIVLFFILGLAVPPLIFSWYIPLTLYKFYFLDFLPHLSGLTSLSGFNQSFYGVIERLYAGGNNLGSWTFVPIHPWLKTGGMILTLSILAYIVKKIWNGSIKNFIITAFAFMAIIPVISQYGWEYIYVFALPLILLVSLYVLSEKTFTRYTFYVVLGVILFWIPKPSDIFIDTTIARLPPVLYQLFFGRWIIASLLFCITAYGYFRLKEKNTEEFSIGGTVNS